MNPTYGLWDTKDHLWMGSGKRPMTYKDGMIGDAAIAGFHQAAIAAAILNERFQWPLTRIRARLYLEKATRIRDTLTPPHSATEAVKRIESRVRA